MYFPVAGIEVHPLVPPLVAFVVSFFTSMGGVSGAFLLLPFQMSFLGYTAPSVSGTNQLFNIVAIPSGVWRYVREGRMVWPLTWVVVAGTLPGVLIGAVVRVAYLPDPGSFKFFAGLVLLYIGGRMCADLLGLGSKRKCPQGGRGDGTGCAPKQRPGQPLRTSPGGEQVRMPGQDAGAPAGEHGTTASHGAAAQDTAAEGTHAAGQDTSSTRTDASTTRQEASTTRQEASRTRQGTSSAPYVSTGAGGREQGARSGPDSEEQTRREREKAGMGASVRVTRCSLLRIAYEFRGEEYDFSTPGIFALSLLVGVVGGIYGIGGGAIVAPFFVSVFGLPVYTVAGAALMGTFVTSVAGVVFYQAIAPFYPTMSVAPDWGLGILFGLGGMAGMYLGARCQKHVPAKLIKWMLCAIIVGTALKYVVGN